jgi:hypothetical protein
MLRNKLTFFFIFIFQLTFAQEWKHNPGWYGRKNAVKTGYRMSMFKLSNSSFTNLTYIRSLNQNISIEIGRAESTDNHNSETDFGIVDLDYQLKEVTTFAKASFYYRRLGSVSPLGFYIHVFCGQSRVTGTGRAYTDFYDVNYNPIGLPFIVNEKINYLGGGGGFRRGIANRVSLNIESSAALVLTGLFEDYRDQLPTERASQSSIWDTNLIQLTGSLCFHF